MSIREANEADAAGMVALSERKRSFYETYSPIFWRKSDQSSEVQLPYFKELIKSDDYITLVNEDNKQLNGFIIGHITIAPEVYDPGGKVCIIDDFAILGDVDWQTIGAALKSALELLLRKKKVKLTITVCGHLDESKREFLSSSGDRLTSEWYVKEL